VRQPPAPSAPLRALRTERLARAPSRRHPAPPCPSRTNPSRGTRSLDLEDARLELLTSSRPSRDGVAIAHLAARDLIARFRVDRFPADSRQPERSDLPSRGQVGGGPSCRPGGPALMGFRTSSNRLKGESDSRCSAYTPFGPEALRALHLG